MAKRVFDILVASLALLAFAPIWVWVAWRTRRESPGPLLERNRRAGRGGIPFQMLTFRSPASSFVQQYQLEWVPQLINVVRGDMSLVGPRPERVEVCDKYNWNEKRILAIRPGLTDWCSLWNRNEAVVLAGAPNPKEAYDRVIRPHKIRLQLYYLDSRTFVGDLRILAATLMWVISKNYTPATIKAFPTFRELRADVARLVATEQIHRAAIDRRAA